MRRRIIIICICLTALTWAYLWFASSRQMPPDARPKAVPIRLVSQPEPREPEANSEPERTPEPAAVRKSKAKKSKEEAAREAQAADELFNSLAVLRIQIEISPQDMNALRGSNWRWNQERPAVPAIVREGGVVYTNVAVHLKGSMGSFRPVYDNPALTLNFQKLAPGQSFHGLHKLSLNNSVQDRSFMTERICRELFAAAGVPVARAGYATVMLNDRNIGLHVLTEGYNKQFVKRFFAHAKGNLYDGGFLQDITEPLTVNSGDDPKDDSGLKALIAAVSEPDPNRRLARLERALDMDQFLTFIALEVMLCHWDGYAMHHNNWRIYDDLDTHRMVFIPHGMDQMFGFPRVRPDCPIRPYMEGMVAAAVVNTETGQRRYLERMAQLYDKVFKVEAILKRVEEIAAVLRPVITGGYPRNAEYYDGQVQFLRQRITERDQSLRTQLAEANPYKFRPLARGFRYGPGRRARFNFPASPP